MWRRRQAELPFASGGRAPPKNLKQLHLPTITFAKCVSWLWTGGAVSLLLFGILSCRRNSERTSLKCDASVCTFSSRRPGGINQLLSFPRENLVRAEQIKLRNGEIADVRTVARRKQNMLAQSYSVTWNFLDDNGKPISTTTEPMSRRGIGRRRPREMVQEVMSYVRRETHSLDATEASRISALGIVFLILGSMLLLTRFAVGDLGEAFDGDSARHGHFGGSGARRTAGGGQRAKKRG